MDVCARVGRLRRLEFTATLPGISPAATAGRVLRRPGLERRGPISRSFQVPTMQCSPSGTSTQKDLRPSSTRHVAATSGIGREISMARRQEHASSCAPPRSCTPRGGFRSHPAPFLREERPRRDCRLPRARGDNCQPWRRPPIGSRCRLRYGIATFVASSLPSPLLAVDAPRVPNRTGQLLRQCVHVLSGHSRHRPVIGPWHPYPRIRSDTRPGRG